MIENLLVAQHTQVNRHLLAGILYPWVSAGGESGAGSRFYWLEVVEMVDCANRLAGTLSTDSSGGWRSPALCAPVRR